MKRQLKEAKRTEDRTWEKATAIPFSILELVPCSQVKRQLKEAKRTEDRVWENASVKEVCARIARFLDREELDKAYSLLLR